MTTLTIEKLGDTVGAEVVGVDRDRLMADDALPAWTLDALEAHGALVFRDLHVDDTAQVAFSRKPRQGRGVRQGRAPRDLPGHARPPEEPDGRLPEGHLRLAHRRDDRGHPDHGHAAERPGRRDQGRARRSSRAPTRPTTTSPRRSRTASAPSGSSTRSRPRSCSRTPTRPRRSGDLWRSRPSKEHPLVWKHRSGRCSLVLGATTSHVVGMDAEESRAFLDGLLARATRPERVYRHEWQVGDMVIWDNRGVLHRACPYDPTSARDMHRTTLPARRRSSDHRRRTASRPPAAP